MNSSLSEKDILAELESLEGWEYKNDKLIRDFEFGDFKEAMSFLVRIGFEAEAHQHHPEIQNVYNRVTVSLSTHDAGDVVTDKDTKLARAINDI